MYITNVTDYDNMTDIYNDSLSLSNNCTNYEIIIDIIIPALLITKPSGRSFLCLISFMVCTLINLYSIIIDGEISIPNSSS